MLTIFSIDNGFCAEMKESEKCLPPVQGEKCAPFDTSEMTRGETRANYHTWLSGTILCDLPIVGVNPSNDSLLNNISFRIYKK